MNLIDKQIQKIKSEKRMGLMAHVVAGYPDIKTTRKLVLMMDKAGADFIEIQIPFSDPLGDGAVIRVANTSSLEKGFRVKDAFSLVKKLKRQDKIKTPILFMTYFNIVYNYGVEKFCQDARLAGASGLIIPDYPDAADKHENLGKYAKANHQYLIKFLALDSSKEKINQTNKKAQGFVYLFSRRGVTGEQAKVLKELEIYLKKYKKNIKIPLGVGFGISQKEHIQKLKGKADIAIVGSAIIKAYDKEGIKGAEKKVKELISALK